MYQLFYFPQVIKLFCQICSSLLLPKNSSICALVSVS